MELESVACNNCGAPLTVPEGVNFVTCSHCNSQLAVKRNESILYTERLTQLEGRTDTMADELQRLKMQQELNRLDDDWNSEKQTYMIRQKNGAGNLPDEGAAIMGPVVSIIGLIVLGVVMLSVRDGIQFMCLPMLLFAALVAWICYDYYNKLNSYNQAIAAYYSRRDQIVERYKTKS